MLLADILTSRMRKHQDYIYKLLIVYKECLTFKHFFRRFCFQFSGWHWRNFIYKFIPLPWSGLSWTEAERYCKEMERGHLLSIRTLKESRWVTSRIRQIRRVLGFSKFWIGASDIGHQGVFEWTEKNSSVTYTRLDTTVLEKLSYDDDSFMFYFRISQLPGFVQC